MKKYILGLAILCLVTILTFVFWPKEKGFEANSWEKEIKEIGFTSSPRATDLNNDGIKDIILGGAGTEFDSIQHGVIALDGRNGELLWKVPARNQVISSAILKDINNDGVDDVFIGGRSAILYAINGATGKLFWEYLPNLKDMDLVNDPKLLNFYSPQFLPDVDNDNVHDILVSFGGFVKAMPYDDTVRPSGKLMIVSGKTGKLLHSIDMPDGKETYMSPIVHKFKNDNGISIIFGSGGETIRGNLYKIYLRDLLTNSGGKAKILAKGIKKGFIAPPVLVDVNKDGIKDIVANAVEGKTFCINGKTNEELWVVSLDDKFHVYTVPAIGNFVGDDEVPDFYSGFSFAPWSEERQAVHILIDGKEGKLVSADTIGVFQYASSTVYNFINNDFDEALVATNEYGVIPNSGFDAKFYLNGLKVLNFKDKSSVSLRPLKVGSNLGTTPLITDIDNDGWLDIISCYSKDGQNLYSFKNGIIERTELKVKKRAPIDWGEYMGPQYNGVWR